MPVRISRCRGQESLKTVLRGNIARLFSGELLSFFSRRYADSLDIFCEGTAIRQSAIFLLRADANRGTATGLSFMPGGANCYHQMQAGTAAQYCFHAPFFLQMRQCLFLSSRPPLSRR